MRKVNFLPLGLIALTIVLLWSKEEVSGTSRLEKPKQPKHIYVGVGKCKMCHMARGNQYGVWKKSKHAGAFKTLFTEKSKEIAQEAGISEEPWASAQCLKCHTTAYGVEKKWLKTSFKQKDGVQCEACHGPGADYTKIPIMKKRTKAQAAGLIIGDRKTCFICHNEKSPTWDPNRDTDKDGKKTGFDFESRWKEIKHPLPEPAE